jgi:hypothetical protein
MKYIKNLYGGNDIIIDNNKDKQLQNFFAIVILGYFIIKIIFPLFFNFYPQKYYFRNIEVNTGEEKDDSIITNKIALNAYIPGIWNNEVIDFITLIVLVFIIYIFTNFSSKTFITTNGNINKSFIIGYIIGLTFPLFIQNYINLFRDKPTEFVTQLSYLIFILIFSSVIIILNYFSINKDNENKITNQHINYLVYVLCIVLVLSGLYIFRKKTENYNSICYYYGSSTNVANCRKTDGVIETSGDNLKLTIPFIVFIILLLFSYEPSDETWKNLYAFVYAILLGILVSSISYYGFEYFLEKRPQKECNSLEECKYRKMNIPDENAFSKLNKPDISKPFDNINKSTGNISLLRWFLIVFIIIVLIYLINFYFFQKK